jgi:hypothetical protein
VIEEYRRAMETQDVGLYKSLIPSLSADGEKQLREAFKVIKSQQVGIRIQSVQVDPSGTNASVKVERQDTINGRQMKPVQQTFRLVRASSGWTIQSMQ